MIYPLMSYFNYSNFCTPQEGYLLLFNLNINALFYFKFEYRIHFKINNKTIINCASPTSANVPQKNLSIYNTYNFDKTPHFVTSTLQHNNHKLPSTRHIRHSPRSSRTRKPNNFPTVSLAASPIS